MISPLLQSNQQKSNGLSFKFIHAHLRAHTHTLAHNYACTHKALQFKHAGNQVITVLANNVHVTFGDKTRSILNICKTKLVEL